MSTGASGSGRLWASGWLTTTTSLPVPVGVLDDGRTYWWRVYTFDGSMQTNPTWVRSFRVDRRLGSDGTQPFDSMGLVSVNLANGNLVTQVTGPTLATVGGGVSVGLTYNSQAVPGKGLQGAYFADTNQNGLFDDGGAILSRTDTQVSFDWGSASPAPAMLDNHFLARWSGLVTVPLTGSYTFGASADDGIRIWVNGVPVLNRWSSASGVSWGSPISLTAATPVAITVEYRDATGPAAIDLRVQGAVSNQPVPAAWLSPQVEVLPTGWTLSATAGLAVRSARVGAESVVITDDTGMTVEYRWNGTGYIPPAGEDGSLVRNADGTLTFDNGGYLVVFRPDGSVQSVRNALDDTQPAASTYSWDSVGRLTGIGDPVSARTVTLRYGGDAACPAGPPSGLSVAPGGMVCAVVYPDATSTVVWYTTAGELARVVHPGGAIVDFAYSGGRVTQVRDPLAADAVAAGIRVDDATTRTVIAYDGAGRVSSVTLPEPTAGAARPTHTFAYNTGQTIVSSPHQSAPGVLHTVTFDATGRVLTDTDATGKVTETVWDTPDRVKATKDPAGRVTYTTYDPAGRPTDVYGPSTSCATNGTCSPAGSYPVTHSAYDQNIPGLAGTFWSNATMAGTPAAHGTGSGNPDGSMNNSFPFPITGAAVSGRWTGEITLPAAGTYQFFTNTRGGTRVYIDDMRVVDDWTDKTTWTNSTRGNVTNPTAGSVHRITVEHYDANGTPGIQLLWTPPGGVDQTVPGANLKPRYGLVTTTTTDDNNGVPAQVVTTGYATPHLGLPTSTTVDPAGLALTSTTSYEAPGSGFLRRTSRTLPAGAGSTNTYSYYGATETADDPCTGPVEAIPQAGLLKTSTAADPDGGGAGQPIVREQRYDSWGRVVAFRVGTGPWTCTTYDSRGRVVSVASPAFGGSPARTGTTSYAVGANPLVSSVTDPAGTISTTVDLLGRVVSYTDVWNKTTTTGYDPLGRVTQTVGPAGTLTYAYDAAGRVETMSLDALVVADPAYTTAGELASVAYPTGAGNTGNGTTLTTIAKDPAGRLTGLTWTLAAGTTVTDAVTRSQSGRVIDETIDGVDAYPAGQNFTYDAAGRLATARVPGHTYTYGYAASGGCGVATAAGKNTNRTTLVVDGGTPVTYCYDHADRLTSTAAAGYTGAIAYDAHGNTTTIAGETRAYDAVDRHLATTKGATTVTYTRDATDRIVARNDGTTTVKYAYSASGDTGDATLDAAGNVTERTITLPGGLLLTRRVSSDVWSYPNIHGGVIATAHAAGVKQGSTMHWGPNGETLTAVPDNSAGAFDNGWLGQHQRPLEHEAGLAQTIEMGARQYDPALGRFLETDPVEGGCANDYVYVHGDPLNEFDLTGMSASSCRAAIGRVWSEAFARKGLVHRYVKGLFFRDGDPGHVAAFNQEKNRLAKATRNLNQECGKGGPPGGGLGIAYRATYALATVAQRVRYPGALFDGGFHLTPTQVIIGGLAALAIVVTDGAAAPFLAPVAL